MFKSTTKLLRLSEKFTNAYFKNIHLHGARLAGAKTYEGEGKTSVQILNNEADLGLMVNAASQVGFRLNNGMTVLGPMIIFPRSVLSWNVSDISNINEDSLSLFTILDPKLDILVLGIGDKPEDLSIYRRLLPIGRKMRLSLEILPTEQACATFNFLNSESRSVAGAMIPPTTINPSEDEILKSKLRYQNLYETDDPKLI